MISHSLHSFTLSPFFFSQLKPFLHLSLSHVLVPSVLRTSFFFQSRINICSFSLFFCFLNYLHNLVSLFFPFSCLPFFLIYLPLMPLSLFHRRMFSTHIYFLSLSTLPIILFRSFSFFLIIPFSLYILLSTCYFFFSRTNVFSSEFFRLKFLPSSISLRVFFLFFFSLNPFDNLVQPISRSFFFFLPSTLPSLFVS